jgi:hypothetical protein
MMYKRISSLLFVLLIIGAQPSAAYVAQENQGGKTSVEVGSDRDLPREMVLWDPAAKQSIEITNWKSIFEVMNAIENAGQVVEAEGKGDKLGTLELDERKRMAIYYSKDRSSVLLEWEERTKVMDRRKFFALFQSEGTADPLPPGEEKDVLPLPPGEGVHPDDFIPLS